MPKIYRKVTYRLYPASEQIQGLWLMFHGHRDLYNALLEQRRSAWRQQRRQGIEEPKQGPS